MEGFVPDVIINDYLDLMVANYNVFSDNEYNQQKRISEELRAIAQEYNVPMITASQTNRGASDKDIISGTDIAESYGKVFTSDLLVTINQNMKERLEGRCNLYIAKNRNGPSGVMIPLNIIYEMMNVTEITTEQSLVTESEKERIIDGKY
jgi:replicative DNA helicase